MVILQEGIHNPSGGIDLACQNVRHGVDAGHSHVADPQHGIDAIVIHKVQLEAVGGVQQDDNLLEHALLLQLLQVGEHINFILVQPQIVAVGHVSFQLRQSAGQVCALAAGTSQHHQRHITILCPGLLQGIGVLCPGHFIDAILRLVAAGGIRIHPGVAAGSVEFPLIQVYGIRAKGFFQRRLQRNGIICRHLTGAGSAVEQIERRLGEGGELRPLCQRQGIVPVHQKGCALCLDVPAQLLFVSHQVVFIFIVAPKENLGIRVGDDLLRCRSQRHVDGCGKIAGHRNCHGGNHRQDSKNDCQNRP